MKNEKTEKKEKKEKKVKAAKPEKPAKKEKKERKDLTTLMNVLMVIGSVLICAGLTVWNLLLQYAEGLRKIDAIFTSAVFTNIIAFGFLGVLIMYGIRKLVLRK